MSKIGKYVGDFVSGLIVEVIGWLFCISFLLGAYLVGRGLAIRYLGGLDPEMIGLLSAAALIWVYEHRNLEHKYDRLREQLDNRGRL